MSTTVTPNMNLTLPGVLTEPGPAYASEINDDLSTIDGHDHTPQNGVPVPTAGLNINADLPFNGFRAYSLNSVTCFNLNASPSAPLSAYFKDGEFCIKDVNGTEVVITNNGSVAGATGSISGLVSPASAVYSAITKTVAFSADTNQAAKIAGADYLMYKFADTSGQALTLKWAPSSPSAYTLQFPDAAPDTADSVAKTNMSGVQTFNAYGIVPVGGIIAIASNLTGAFTIPTTGTSSRGWQLCDGAAVEAGATLSGNVPTLNDSRFLMGSSSSGSTGGSNTASITGTQSIAHTHNISHTHMWAFWDNGLGVMESNSTSNSSSTTTSGGGIGFGTTQSNAGSTNTNINKPGAFSANQAVYTSGALSAPSGSGSSASSGSMSANSSVDFSNASLNSGSMLPKYLTCVYLIRIK